MFVKSGLLHTAHSIYIKQHETLAYRTQPVIKEAAPQHDAAHDQLQLQRSLRVQQALKLQAVSQHMDALGDWNSGHVWTSDAPLSFR
jgi:hypothetical protein